MVTVWGVVLALMGGFNTINVSADFLSETEACGICDGKISRFVLQYNGAHPALVEVLGDKEEMVFSRTLSPFEFFELSGFDKKGTLGPKIWVFIDGALDTRIHTSCSEPILVGMTFGSFTVRDGASRNGGEICAEPGYVDVGHACGTVFEDKNLDGMQDSDEKAHPDILVTITDALGVTFQTSPDESGAYCAHNLAAGEGSVTVEEESLPEGTRLVGGTNPGSVRVTANSVTEAGTDFYAYAGPEAFDTDLTTREDTPIAVTLQAEDNMRRPLSYTLLTPPKNGILNGDAPNLTYTPTPQYNGEDSFTFKVDNGVLDSDIATVRITVLPLNDAPVAVDDKATTEEDTNVTIDLLANDSDSDGNINPDSLMIITHPENGDITIADQKVIYSAGKGYAGTDTFTYLVSDGVDESNVASVNVLVVQKGASDCSEETIQTGQFEPVVKWHWDGSRTEIDPGSVETISVPVVAQLSDDNGDGFVDASDNPDIVFVTFEDWGFTKGEGTLRAVDGKTGNELWSIPRSEYTITPNSYNALGDIDNDGLIEIVTRDQTGHVVVFENDGTFKWKSEYSSQKKASAISLADINNDGSVEIIMGTAILDSDGNLTIKIDSPYLSDNFNGEFSTVVDLDGDGISEILNGSAAYKIDGSLLWDANLGNGFTSIANFDNDPFPEIVFVGGQKVYLLDHAGAVVWGPVALPGTNRNMGGPPTIADMDGDGEPEIGVAAYTYFSVFEADGALKWRASTWDDSEVTGSTVFDFEGDGKAEILYSDERFFRIYDGETGATRLEIENSSLTSREYPVVADIDNDGHAEIVLPANRPYVNGQNMGIRVIEDANDSWMPTRSIWNQHSYHIANINDDGTIPSVEEASWLTHNTYRLNTFQLESRCLVPPKAFDDTVITQENTAASIKLVGMDRNGDTLSYQIVNAPEHGILEGTGAYRTYIPEDGFAGDDSLTFKVSDGSLESDEADISIKVLASDNVLVASDDDISLLEDQTIPIEVLTNDSNATGGVSIAVVVSPMQGNATIENGKIVYTPKTDYFGEDAFYYTYRDSNGFVSNSAKVTLHIGAVNDAPVAFDQNRTVSEDGSKSIYLVSSDIENDAIRYTITAYPQHGTLNGVAPSVSFTPDADFYGTDHFTFTTDDGAAASNTATVAITVVPKNDAPVAVTGNYTDVTVGSSVILDGANSYDVDGDIVAYRWEIEGSVISSSHEAAMNDLPVGRYKFTLTVTDDQGLVGSDSVTISVISNEAVDVTPPTITVLGNNPRKIYIGDAYVDAGATAFDNSDGEVGVGVSYGFDTGVEGVYTVTYTAVDTAGNQANAYRHVMVVDNATPDTIAPVITLLGDNPMELMLGSDFIDPGVSVTDDYDVRLGYTNAHNVNTGALGKYWVVYNATDSAGNSAEEVRRTVYVKDPNGNHPPVAFAGYDIAVEPGESVTFDASASYDPDGEIVSYTWRENGDTLSTQLVFSIPDFTMGLHEVVLTVTDNEGAVSSDTVLVRVIDPNDTTPPEAAFISPAEGEHITYLTDIVGTANDDNLAYYRLFIAPASGGETLLAEGTHSVTEDVLATLDPTLLRNGIYKLRLVAVDINGYAAQAETNYIVTGKAKIGNFGFTVTDFDINVAGLPLQVNRTYSTLQKSEQLAFGYGWSLDYNDVRLEENRVPGREWRAELSGDIIPSYCYRPDAEHYVSISLPDGTTESFDFGLTSECGHNPQNFTAVPTFRARNGSEAKLQAMNAPGILRVDPNSGTLVDIGNVVYNPSRYRLTLPNGMVFEIKENAGIQKITDLQEQNLTFTANGIESTRGEALAFERDNAGRITKITDLAGRVMRYVYDANGDLDYVIDPLDQHTEYTYDDAHTLTEYLMPGDTAPAITNYYDESGRLIRTVDALGNEVLFEHDLDGRQEVVYDKLNRPSVYVYDDEGNVLSHTNPAGETTAYIYDARGNELTVTNDLDETTTNTYDANDNLLSTTDPLGHRETTEYNAYGSPTVIKDKNENPITFTYNAYNAPRSLATASGATTTFYYDQFGNKTIEIDEHNQTTTYEYDHNWIPFLGATTSKGHLLKETWPNGTVIEHSYDDAGNVISTKTTSPDNTVTTTGSSYDAFNRVVSETDERGHTVTHAYDGRGNKIRSVDVDRGQETLYEYRPDNKLTKTTYFDGTTEEKTYDAMGNVLSETDREGRTTRYEYDGADRVVKTIYHDGSSTATEYDRAGRTIRSTDGNGNAVTYAYDKAGNRTGMTDADLKTTTYTYDKQGNKLSETDPLLQTTRFEYNELNQQTKTIYPDGNTTETEYDPSGKPIAKTDRNGRTTTYAYDTLNGIMKLSAVTTPDGLTTYYTYDANGNKLTQADKNNHTTRWTYDAYGQMSSHTLPLTQSETFTYDAYGKQATRTDYNNKLTTFVYDGNDRLVATEYSDGTGITYDYTPGGMLKSVTNTEGTVTYTYDARGRTARVDNPGGSYIAYGYDNVGNITSIQTADRTVTKTYDKRNRLKTVTDETGTTTYDYDALGRQTEVIYPNGTRALYGYDALNRITKIENVSADAQIISSFVYTLDKTGNRVKVVEHSGRTVQYTYDNLDRLMGETVTNDPSGNNTVTTFTYDDVGNMLSKTIDGIETAYVYNDNDQLTQQNSDTFAYDDNGNLITKTTNDGTTTYVYDARDKLLEVVSPSTAATYRYDADGNRIGKTVDGTSTSYLIDSNTQYAQVFNETTGSNTIGYTYGNDLIAQSGTNGDYFYHYDALGSTRSLSDNTGSGSDGYRYTPYGELIEHTGSTKNGFLFTGEQFDPETENYYLRARYYDPGMSRFTQFDTYEGRDFEPVTLNHYLYGNSNPILHTDFSGRCSTIEEAQYVLMTLGALGAALSTVAIYSPYKNDNPITPNVWLFVGITNGIIFIREEFAAWSAGIYLSGKQTTQSPFKDLERDLFNMNTGSPCKDMEDIIKKMEEQTEWRKGDVIEGTARAKGHKDWIKKMEKQIEALKAWLKLGWCSGKKR